jgi:hypothetical protein
LACPPEENILGYPAAKVPNASVRVRAFGGFQPLRVVQHPPVGSLFNETTTVLVLAADASDRMVSCVWKLTFPDLEILGEEDEELPSGTYKRTVYVENFVAEDALAVMLTASLEHGLFGNATVEVSTWFNETLTLSRSRSEATLWFQEQFSFPQSMEDLSLMVTGLKKQNALTLLLYGQIRLRAIW